MHDLLHCSGLLFGESGTMSSEATKLSTASIYINSNQLDYLKDQEEKFGYSKNLWSSSEDQN